MLNLYMVKCSHYLQILIYFPLCLFPHSRSTSLAHYSWNGNSTNCLMWRGQTQIKFISYWCISLKCCILPRFSQPPRCSFHVPQPTLLFLQLPTNSFILLCLCRTHASMVSSPIPGSCKLNWQLQLFFRLHTILYYTPKPYFSSHFLILLRFFFQSIATLFFHVLKLYFHTDWF